MILGDVVAVPGLFGVDWNTVVEPLRAAEGIVAYALVFFLAAIPWFEILLVIPPAIALGFNPVLVTLLALLGNLSTVLLVIVFQDRVLQWVQSRRDGASRRGKQARKLWDAYGLPILALGSPVVTGTHVGAALALLFGSPRDRVAGWMIVTVVVWAVALGVVSVCAGEYLGIGVGA